MDEQLRSDAGRDNDTVLRVLGGDDHAFDELISHYYSPVLHYLTRACGSEQSAEDILQEVFLQLWRGRDKLPADGFRAYVYTVARNRMLDYLRSSRRSFEREATYSSELPSYLRDDTLGSIEREELASAVHKAVDSLPERAREVWRLNREQGLSYQEIAQILGVSVNTVKTHMVRAGAAIRSAALPFMGLLLAHV